MKTTKSEDDEEEKGEKTETTKKTKTIEVRIKYGKEQFSIELGGRDSAGDDDTTVLGLKRKIQALTNIEIQNQKLPNLRYEDEKNLLECKIPKNVMLLGKSSEYLKEMRKTEKEMSLMAPEILDDFEEDVDEPLLCYSDPVYVQRLENRIEKYKGLEPLNETRESKKLLVLDIDYTLFDHRTPGENAHELMRPYLHEFLSSAYERFDIVIWSATSMLWIKTKMQELGVLSNKRYKICALVDSGSMITVQTKQRGIFNCKPLGWIWAQLWSKQRSYDASNTIMFDDLRRNFAMNPSCGLKIKPFRNAHTSRATDNELKKLRVYLEIIARENVDFKALDHKRWERYVLQALKEGKLSIAESKEVCSFWPQSTIVRELSEKEQPRPPPRQ